jgi:hypothetical protein
MVEYIPSQLYRSPTQLVHSVIQKPNLVDSVQNVVKRYYLENWCCEHNTCTRPMYDEYLFKQTRCWGLCLCGTLLPLWLFVGQAPVASLLWRAAEIRRYRPMLMYHLKRTRFDASRSIRPPNVLSNVRESV